MMTFRCDLTAIEKTFEGGMTLAQYSIIIAAEKALNAGVLTEDAVEFLFAEADKILNDFRGVAGEDWDGSTPVIMTIEGEGELDA